MSKLVSAGPAIQKRQTQTWNIDLKFMTNDATKQFPDSGLPPNSTVHRGFSNSYFLLKSKVMPVLKEALAKKNKVVITGHSLGKI